MEILTASAGSYPRIGSTVDKQKHRQAYTQLEKGEINREDFERVQDEITKEAISEQTKAGLDIVTDGQIRWYDPVSHLARGFEGCEINGLLRFFDTNFYFRQPVVKGKLHRKESMLKREFDFAKGVSRKPVKQVFTGPYTLAKLSINRRGDDFQGLVDEFTEAVAQEVKELAAAGVGIIQVDEPAILKHPKDFKILSASVEKLAARKGKARLALYTYFGDAAPLFEEMLELPVDVIGLDFTYSPKLPAEVARRGCEKSIGLGLIDGRNTRIEKEEEVLKIIKRILPSIKGRTIYLNPSCGLGDFLPREIAFEKLRNMVAIAKKAEEMI